MFKQNALYLLAKAKPLVALAIIFVVLFSTQIDARSASVPQASSDLIVFVRPQPPGDGNLNSDVWIMNADGSNETQLTTWNAADRWPTLSPDGSKIAYVSYRNNEWQLWVMNKDGTNPAQVPMGGNTQSPTWSPDGNKIAFSNDSVDWWEIWTINADGSNPQRLTTHAGASGVPSWSPTGTKIVYINEPSAWSHDLYTVNSDGTGQSLLISASSAGSNHMPAWSPDGTEIATNHYSAGTSSGPFDLWLMNQDSSNGHILVQGIESPYYNNLSWSTDGTWLAFAKQGQIWRVERDGTGPTQITTTGAWEPDIGAGSPPAPFHIYLPVLARNYCEPLYTDNFSNSASGWYSGDSGSALWQYLYGEYQILVRNTNWGAGARTNAKFSNYILAADVRNATGAYGTYGLLFGLSDNWSQFYSLEINPSGVYALWRYNSGWALITYGTSGAVHGGTTTDRLKIERNGSLIRAYANDQLLATASDSSFTGARRLGLTVSSYNNPNVDIRFDNFKVYPTVCESMSGLSELGPLSNEVSSSETGQTGQGALVKEWPNKSDVTRPALPANIDR